MLRKSVEVEIRDLLGRDGFPIFGVAAVTKLSSLPVEFSLQNLLEGAKSIICYGVPIPKGIIYAKVSSLALYWRYCNMLYRTLDSVSNKVCIILEERGYPTVPVYGCYPWRIVNREFWGIAPLVYRAEQAGLGKLKCGLLANPTYGTRILLGCAVTTMELEPSEKLSGEICPPECFECINACPVKAIEKTGKVNHGVCMSYANSNPLLAHLLGDKSWKEKFSFETLMNTVGVDDHSSYSCYECLKARSLNKK
jgi:epoxyqueuosine reductase QueG